MGSFFYLLGLLGKNFQALTLERTCFEADLIATSIQWDYDFIVHYIKKKIEGNRKEGDMKRRGKKGGRKGMK